jgi:SAM-dependent methyltransferase
VVGEAIGKHLNEDFLGGPAELFDVAGREQLIVLLEHGLLYTSRVLDIGCGCLRGGRWIMSVLEPGHYFGIEPQRAMVEKGLQRFVDPKIIEIKAPHFDYNDRFDFSVFGETFTHFMARSIWTHASKSQIETMLDGVVACGEANAILLASFRPPRMFGRNGDYKGDHWVGRSHTSEIGGMVTHSYRWIERACDRRGLRSHRLDRPPVGKQWWIAVSK